MRLPLPTFVMILGLLAGWTAQAPPAIEVRGVVRDVASGKLIRGARVRIGERSGSSDLDGAFSITDVSPGKQLLTVVREDYLFSGIRKPEPGHYPAFRAAGINVTVPAENPFALDVYMNLAPQVSGTVMTLKGLPAEGIQVSAYRLSYDAFGERVFVRASSPGFSGLTDDRGEFALPSLVPGDYVLRVDNDLSRKTVVPTYYPASIDFNKADLIHLRAGDDVRLRPLVLQDDPLLWLTVNATDEAGNEIGLPALTARRIGEPSGLVLREAAGNNLRLTPGRYEIEAGEIRLGRTLVPSQIRLVRATVEIRNANVTLPIQVSKGTETTVRVLYANQGGPEPLNDVPVRLVPKNFLSPLIQPLAGATDSAGMLSFGEIPQGTYGITLPLQSENGDRGVPGEPPLKPVLENACIRQILQGNAPITGEELRIAGNATTLTILLRNSSTRIRGDLGVAGSNATVVLVPDDRKQIAGYLAIFADHDGRFEFKCAQPGTYRLYAWTDLPGAAYRNEEFMSAYRDRGTALEIREGDSLTMKTTLIEP